MGKKNCNADAIVICKGRLWKTAWNDASEQVVAPYIPAAATTTRNAPKSKDMKAPKLVPPLHLASLISSCSLPNFSVEALKIFAASPSFPKIFSTTAMLLFDVCACPTSTHFRTKRTVDFSSFPVTNEFCRL